jgi:hypothetical protein
LALLWRATRFGKTVITQRPHDLKAIGSIGASANRRRRRTLDHDRPELAMNQE